MHGKLAKGSVAIDEPIESNPHGEDRQAGGLHARPAELFVSLAIRFDAEIEVVKDDQRADAKSMLHVLTLAAVQGTELRIEAVGSDAVAAVDALAELVVSDFEVNGTDSQQQNVPRATHAMGQWISAIRTEAADP